MASRLKAMDNRLMRASLISKASGRPRQGVQAFLALVVATLLSGPAGAQGLRCHATDGDTLRCGSERVRVMGLDTPEMRGKCPRETRMARLAQGHMAELIRGGVSLDTAGRDRYGRLLAVVRDRQGRDVAQVMIREGLARPYDGRGRREGGC